MKVKQIRIYLLLTICFLTLFIGIIKAQAGKKRLQKNYNLTVTVDGLNSNKGSVIMKLYNSKVGYKTKDAEPFMMKSVLINDFKAEAKFNNLKSGEYAIKLFHDENSNNKHDKNFLGIPKEEYAFSNNVVGSFGPPDYERAKFKIENDLIITISISKRNE